MILALCSAPAVLPNLRDIVGKGREGKHMYLKKGDIGKAEPEEVVPVETEMEIISQAGPTSQSREAAAPASHAGCQDRCRVQRVFGKLTLKESSTSLSPWNPHSSPRCMEGEKKKSHFTDEEKFG